MYFSSRFAPSSSRHPRVAKKKSQGPTRGLARFGRDLLTSNAPELKHDGISKSRLVPWVHFRRRGDTSASKTPPPPLIVANFTSRNGRVPKISGQHYFVYVSSGQIGADFDGVLFNSVH